MKMTTRELTGPALAYAVMLAEGWNPADHPADMAPYLFTQRRIKPDVDWDAGGRLIDREGVMFQAGDNNLLVEAYLRSQGTSGPRASGPTHLIAACRVFVLDALGEEVEIPEEVAHA
jgi:hypothetical protein